MALTPRREAPSLGQICSSLSESIESTMHALYNLETATINTIGKSRQYESSLFEAIRKSNKDEWNQIVQHLERSAQCGREIEIFGANFFKAPTSELLEHAKEIAEDSSSLLAESQRILEDRISFLKEFTKPEKHLTATFEKSHPTTVITQDFYDDIGYVSTSGAAQLVRETRKNMYVDGLEALGAFNTANEDIRYNISALVEFWKKQNDVCTHAISGISDISSGRGGLTMEEANKIATDWREALPELKNAGERIYKMSDVVMTSAVGAPRSRQDSNNTSAGKSSNITAAIAAAATLGAVVFQWERVGPAQAATFVQTAVGSLFNNLGDGIASSIAHALPPIEEYNRDTSSPLSRPPPIIVPSQAHYELNENIPGYLDINGFGLP